jgi:hypothetical protein
MHTAMAWDWDDPAAAAAFAETLYGGLQAAPPSTARQPFWKAVRT